MTYCENCYNTGCPICEGYDEEQELDDLLDAADDANQRELDEREDAEWIKMYLIANPARWQEWKGLRHPRFINAAWPMKAKRFTTMKSQHLNQPRQNAH